MWRNSVESEREFMVHANWKNVFMVIRNGQIQEIIDPCLSNSIQRMEALYLLMLSINLFFFNQQIFYVKVLCKVQYMHVSWPYGDHRHRHNRNFKNLYISTDIDVYMENYINCNISLSWTLERALNTWDHMERGHNMFLGVPAKHI